MMRPPPREEGRIIIELYRNKPDKDVIKLFSRHGSPIVRVFKPIWRYKNSKGYSSLNRGVKYTAGSDKFVIFCSVIFSLYLGNGTRYAHDYYGSQVIATATDPSTVLVPNNAFCART